MKTTILLIVLLIGSVCTSAKTQTSAFAQKTTEIEQRQKEIEQRKKEIERRRFEIEQRSKLLDAMRRGVVVIPLVTSPDDYINPGSVTDRTLPEELQKTPWQQRLDCYTLKPDQITLAPRSVPTYSVYEIRDTGRETFVTFALPITWDPQWHALSKGWVMVDNENNNRYFPRRIENNIPFDKVLVINEAKGHTVLFTIVYPRLSTTAKSVTFTDAWPIKTELPLNRAPRRDMVVENVQKLTRNKGRDIF